MVRKDTEGRESRDWQSKAGSGQGGGKWEAREEKGWNQISEDFECQVEESKPSSGGQMEHHGRVGSQWKCADFVLKHPLGEWLCPLSNSEVIEASFPLATT